MGDKLKQYLVGVGGWEEGLLQRRKTLHFFALSSHDPPHKHEHQSIMLPRNMSKMSVFQLSVHSVHLTAQNDRPGDRLSFSHKEHGRTSVSWFANYLSPALRTKIIKIPKERTRRKDMCFNMHENPFSGRHSGHLVLSTQAGCVRRLSLHFASVH